MKAATEHHIRLADRLVEYRVVRSKTARKLRVRVCSNGVEVVQPDTRSTVDVESFLDRNAGWVLNQLDRASRLRVLRRPIQRRAGEILFRGEPTRVRVEKNSSHVRGSVIIYLDGEILIRQGTRSRTPVARSLENWLRKEARMEIERHLSTIEPRIGQRHGRVYVMGQRTKWGNCSQRRNLSFNWRLVMAPEFVLRYLVTHEAVHLAIPDHSAKFWLTVQSLCRETERAKQWLCSHQAQLTVQLATVLS